MSETVYVVWERYDGRDRLLSICEEKEDAVERVDEYVEGVDFDRDGVVMEDRGIYSKYACKGTAFGAWVTREWLK